MPGLSHHCTGVGTELNPWRSVKPAQLEKKKSNQSHKQAPNKVADSRGKSCQNGGMLCGVPASQPAGNLQELLVSLLHKDKSD